MIEAPQCQIYLDADLPETDLVSLISETLFEQPGAPECEVEIRQNSDYDLARRKKFPDGFIYFRYVLDLYIEEASPAAKAALIAPLLQTLWEWGYPAVAACSFETFLPQGGGYKNRSLPWPRG